MLDPREMYSSADVEDAMMRLYPLAVIRDFEYWRATVGRIERGYHPDRQALLTLSTLNAWVERCLTNPDENIVKEPCHGAGNPPRSITPAN